jgi:hypothetical protein
VFDVTCVVPPGFVDNPTTATTTTTTSTGATELCDLSTVTAMARFRTTSPTTTATFVECEATADCNDGDSNIHPGADELCTVWTMTAMAPTRRARSTRDLVLRLDGDDYGGAAA